MNRFRVVLDLITISSPRLHWGHDTSPFFGEFVPRMMYFLSFDDQERYPFESKYCMISFLKMLVFDFVVFARCLTTGFLTCTVLVDDLFDGFFNDEFTKTIFIGTWVSDNYGKGLCSWRW